MVFKETEKREFFMKIFIRRLLMVLLCVISFSPGLLHACAVCFGDPKSPLTIGAKAGVALMLGVLGVVLGGILAAIIFFARRAKLAEVQEIIKRESQALR
jgi:hypothetical protein